MAIRCVVAQRPIKRPKDCFIWKKRCDRPSQLFACLKTAASHLTKLALFGLTSIVAELGLTIGRNPIQHFL